MRCFIYTFLLITAQMFSATAADLQGALKRISVSGEIKIGYRAAERPMSFEDQAGKPVGYSIDLCAHIASAVKKELGREHLAEIFIPVTAENRFSALETGEIDILCGATTKTLSRSERVDFTQLTFVTGASLVSRDDNIVVGIESLQGKRVAVVSNTTTIDALKRRIAEAKVDAQVVAVGSADEGMDMLDRGDVDAFSSDQVVLIGLVAGADESQRYLISSELFSFEPFALAIPRDDSDFRLLADRALSKLNRTGKIWDIYAKWFSRFSKNPPKALVSLYQLNATPE